MFTFDLRTIYISYILVNIVNLLLSSTLYIQIKKRFPGTIFIVLSMSLNTVGNVLVFLRNIIPDFISIPIANLLIVLSMVFMLKGLEQFIQKKRSHTHHYILLIVFFIIHCYFTYIDPNLKARHINVTLVFLLYSFQIVYLMLITTPLAMRKTTRAVAYVFGFAFATQLIRLFLIFQNKESVNNYFSSGSIEAIFILSWELIIILLAYSLSLMYNKRLINNINAQEEKFSKAFHSAPFMIMLSQIRDGKILEVNNKILSISGYHPNELIGLNTTDLDIWKNDKDRAKFISEIKLNGAITENEFQFRKKSGELFPGLISAELVDIDDETCVISVINNISNRKQSELKIKESEASLRKLNSTKDKFFSIIAHDLKSPFNGILGFSKILSDQVKAKGYEGIDEYAEIINTSSKHAVNLLSNLMEWSMTQTGKMVFNTEYVDIVAIINSTLALLKTSSDQKSINISLHTPNKMILYVDKIMIEVTLRNLISNAIKFTHSNGDINIYIKEQKEDFLFSIIDNGVGIEDSNLDKLFRIENTYSTHGTHNERGTGLGLILCKDFIKYHKGEIWVESEPNIGSKFYFSLPKSYH